MKFEDFTKEQRYIIAEFVYANDTDTLIKSEGFDLVTVFKEKNIIDSDKEKSLKHAIKNNLPVLMDLLNILTELVNNEEGTKIMKEYLSDVGVL